MGIYLMNTLQEEVLIKSNLSTFNYFKHICKNYQKFYILLKFLILYKKQYRRKILFCFYGK